MYDLKALAVAFGALSIVALGAVGPAHAHAEAAKASPESAAQWRSQFRAAQFVTMSDGTRLAVDIVLPRQFAGQGEPPVRFPVIFRYTPYGRESLEEPRGEMPAGAEPDFFVARGYALVSADMRGTGASEGWMNQMSDVVRADGKALVDWIAAQPWSTGRVGMIGGSYEGWSQLAVASMKPAALKAIVPRNPGWDAFKTHPGGVLSYAFMQIWSAMTHELNHGATFKGFPLPPAAPVLDEDGDGELADEIPMDLNGNGLFYDDYAWPLSRGAAPRYADGVARKEHAYLKAILQHHADPAGAPGTYDGFTLSQAMPFRDTPRPGDGLTAPDLNWSWLPQVRDSGVAVLLHGGWFDPFVLSVFQLQATLASGTAPHLIATPTYHQGVSPAFAKLTGFDDGEDIVTAHTLRWFDHHLKQIDNGVAREPNLLLFVMNEGWRNAERWPLPEQRAKRLYLESGKRLAAQSPSRVGKDSYKADFTHQSGWGPVFDTAAIGEVNARIPRPPPVSPAFLRNRQFMFGVPEGPPVRTELDRKAMVYTSAPLEEDMDVIGHPLVNVWASSSAKDGDFYFYLEDVAPDGEAVLVTEYQHRAGFSRLMDNDGIIPRNPGIDVKPELPWHGFDRADYDANVFANGRVVPVRTALFPTAWRFRKGHSVRLSIAAADWPAFELHPALAPQNRPDAPDTIEPTIGIHRGGKTASFVELPVVPHR